MIVVPWPTQLPDYLESWSEKNDPVVEWTAGDQGDPKVRGRFTIPVRRISCSMMMHWDKYSLLRDFFDNDLEGGVNQFTFKHPYQVGLQKFHMTEPPVISSEGPMMITVAMQWLQKDVTIVSPPLDFWLTVVAGDGQATLTWTQSQFADNYRVYVNDVPWGAVLPNTAFQSVVTGLANNVEARVRVVASNSYYDDKSSNEVAVTPNPVVLPGNCTFTATAQDERALITITSPASAATHYELRTGDALPGTLVFDLQPNQFPFTVNNLVNGVQVKFWIIAKNPAGSTNSSSNPQAVTPFDPSPGDFDWSLRELEAAIEINLESAAADADTYQIRQGETSPGTLVAEITAAQFPYSDAGIPTLVDRTYWLAAVNEFGTTYSSHNPKVGQAAAQMAPTSPVFSVAPLIGGAQINLVTPADRALTYQIKRGGSEAGATLVADIAGSAFPFIDQPLTAGVAVTYWFYAVNSGGQTSASNNSQSAIPEAQPIVPPSAFGFTATPGIGQVVLALSPPSTGASHYQIWRGIWPSMVQLGGDHLLGAFPYTDSGLTNGVAQSYWLSAFNFQGLTQATGNPQVATPSDIPGVFTISATPGDGHVIIGLASTPTGATFYRLSEAVRGDLAGDMQVSEFPYTDNNLINGVQQSYTVTAHNIIGSRTATNAPLNATPSAGGVETIPTVMRNAWVSGLGMTGNPNVTAWADQKAGLIVDTATSGQQPLVYNSTTKQLNATESPIAVLMVSSMGTGVAVPWTLAARVRLPSSISTSIQRSMVHFGNSARLAVRDVGPSTLHIDFNGGGTSTTLLSPNLHSLRGQVVDIICKAIDATNLSMEINGTLYTSTTVNTPTALTNQSMQVNRTSAPCTFGIVKLGIAASNVAGADLTATRTWLATDPGGGGGGPGPIAHNFSTDSRARLVMDPALPFASHRSNMTIMTGVASGFGADTIPLKNVPETGRVVDSAGHNLLRKVTGIPGISATRKAFECRISEACPVYNPQPLSTGAGNTIRVTVGSGYTDEIVVGDQGWWTAGTMRIGSSCYEDMSGRFDVSFHGLHDIGWGVNAGGPPLTGMSWFLLPRADETGMTMRVRVRSNTRVDAGGTWTVAAVNTDPGVTGTQKKEWNYDFYNTLTSAQEHQIIYFMRTGWQASHNPQLLVYHAINGVFRNGGEPVVTHNLPICHRRTDMKQEFRAWLLYSWSHGNWLQGGLYPWPATANGILFSGEHGWDMHLGRCGVWKNTAGVGTEPAITAQRILDWLLDT